MWEYDAVFSVELLIEIKIPLGGFIYLSLGRPNKDHESQMAQE